MRGELVLRWQAAEGSGPDLARGCDAHFLLAALDRARRDHETGRPLLLRRGLHGGEELVATGEAVFTYLRGLICC